MLDTNEDISFTVLKDPARSWEKKFLQNPYLHFLFAKQLCAYNVFLVYVCPPPVSCFYELPNLLTFVTVGLI